MARMHGVFDNAMREAVHDLAFLKGRNEALEGALAEATQTKDAAVASLDYLQRSQSELSAAFQAVKEERDAGKAMLDQRDKEVMGLLNSVQVSSTFACHAWPFGSCSIPLSCAPHLQRSNLPLTRVLSHETRMSLSAAPRTVSPKIVTKALGSLCSCANHESIQIDLARPWTKIPKSSAPQL